MEPQKIAGSRKVIPPSHSRAGCVVASPAAADLQLVLRGPSAAALCTSQQQPSSSSSSSSGSPTIEQRVVGVVRAERQQALAHVHQALQDRRGVVRWWLLGVEEGAGRWRWLN